MGHHAVRLACPLLVGLVIDLGEKRKILGDRVDAAFASTGQCRGPTEAERPAATCPLQTHCNKSSSQLPTARQQQGKFVIAPSRRSGCASQSVHFPPPSPLFSRPH